MFIQILSLAVMCGVFGFVMGARVAKYIDALPASSHDTFIRDGAFVSHGETPPHCERCGHLCKRDDDWFGRPCGAVFVCTVCDAPLDFETRRSRVLAFHCAMGIPYSTIPTRPSRDVICLRADLLVEETIETLEAMGAYPGEIARLKLAASAAINSIETSAFNMVKVADGLADVDYINEGTRLTFGIHGEPVEREVHRTNMAKRGGPVRADGKRLKPEGWTPPDIRGILLSQGWDPTTEIEVNYAE